MIAPADVGVGADQGTIGVVEIDRRVLLRVGPVALRAQVEDPLLGRRIPAEGVVWRCRDDDLVD